MNSSDFLLPPVFYRSYTFFYLSYRNLLCLYTFGFSSPKDWLCGSRGSFHFSWGFWALSQVSRCTERGSCFESGSLEQMKGSFPRAEIMVDVSVLGGHSVPSCSAWETSPQKSWGCVCQIRVSPWAPPSRSSVRVLPALLAVRQHCVQREV